MNSDNIATKEKGSTMSGKGNELHDKEKKMSDDSRIIGRMILDQIHEAGLSNDCPYKNHDGNSVEITPQTIETIMSRPEFRDDFKEYISQVASYLGEVDQSLFSEGLHTLGESPTKSQVS